MKKEFDPVKNQIDGLLSEIAAKQRAIGIMTQAMEGAIARATAQFEPEIKRAQEDLEGIEQELYGLAKYNKAQLFKDTDRVDLKHGAVLRAIQRRVKRIKGMIVRLKALGRVEAIKVVESVDWDQLEKYPDPLLTALGTKRVPKELFSYEIA